MNNNLKVAICFSGSIRDLNTCYPTLQKHLLDPLQPDIFLHLWSLTDMDDLPGKNLKWRPDRCSVDQVLDKLKPVKYVIDRYDKNWEKQIIDTARVQFTTTKTETDKLYAINACGMYYKIRECYRLLKDYCATTKTVYELVIRARLDFIWEETIDKQTFAPFAHNVLYLIKDRYATRSKITTNDKFFAGSMPIMDKMCSLFDYIAHYETIDQVIEGQRLHQLHIEQLNLPVRWIGSMDTYYKCAVRHAIRQCKWTIVMDNNHYLPLFWYELAYYLLMHNYRVIYKQATNASHAKILHCFDHFNTVSSNQNVLCSIQITKENVHYCITINANHQQTTVHLNAAFQNSILVDFVSSLISTRTFNQNYHFNASSIVLQMDKNEPIIYKNLDHGYYPATLIEQKNDIYTILCNNATINTDRKYIRIINLAKYVKNTTMPTNIE